MLSTAIAKCVPHLLHAPVNADRVFSADLRCSDVELVHVNPPPGQTCQAYLAEYLAASGGARTSDGSSTTECTFCTSTSTNSYLRQVGMHYNNAWRDFGLMLVYNLFKCAQIGRAHV